MLINILILVVSLFVVVKSADWFLGSAEKIGVSLGLSPFILGVILVGFGTSLPELATSIAAVTRGVDTVSIANIAGSNIANIFLIVGISTVALGTIKFDKDLIDLDIPLLLAVTALFVILVSDGELSRFDGVLLLSGFSGYILYSLGYKEDKSHHKGLVGLVAALAKDSRARVERRSNMVGPYTLLVLIASIALLAVSSNFALGAMVDIVEELNVAVGVLSFFALAAGTSLPELTVSIKALRAGKSDLMVGNIIGSCMFNMLMVGGVTSVMAPQFADSRVLPWFVVGMMLSVLLMTASTISKRIHIWEGFIYILIYGAVAAKIVG